MTVEEFTQPFQRLALAFNRFAFLSEGDREMLTDDWYDCFSRYDGEAWVHAVDVWKRSHTQFPTQAEMHGLLLDLIPAMVANREEAARQERMRLANPPDLAKTEELRERLRRLKQAMQLKPPAPSDAPPLLPEHTDDDR